MKRSLIVVLAALFCLVVLFPPDMDAQNSAAIRRYAANTRTFGAPNELRTGLAASGSPAGSGGKVIYDKTFFVADDINVLYVTLSATGDTHFGARLQISCLVDRGDGNGLVACNPGPNPIGGAPAGWVTVSRHSGHGEEPALVYIGDGGGGPSDLHDNAIAYTWCTPFEAKPGIKRVQIRLASQDVVTSDAVACVDGPNPCVFLEGVHFFIDGSRIGGDNRCTDIDATDGVSGPPCPDCGPVP